jgi:hypothetical protein
LHPGAHGGTVTAIDDHATDLIDPQPTAALRTVPPAARAEPAQPEKALACCATEQRDQAGPAPPKRGRKDRAIVPSWEDVLLGVRSPQG